MKFVTLVLVILLAGCGSHVVSTPEPIIVIKEVVIPGPPQPCVPGSLGGAPVYVDNNEALLAAPEGPLRYQLVIAGRVQRIARLNELEPVIHGCPKAK